MADSIPDLSTLTRIGQGRAAEVFALDDERVVKVAREGLGHTLTREAVAMSAAHAAGMPVPAVYGLVDIEDRRALIMDRARGTDMLSRFAAKPWTLVGAGAKLGALHARLHETLAPSDLPSLKDELRRRITESPHLDEAPRKRVLATLRDLPDGDRICHLDYHPGNVMTDGKDLTVIDWPSACRGDPLADVAVTMTILRGGKTAPGTPLITRVVAPAGRKLLLSGYRRGYARARPFDRDLLARWMIVAAGMRRTYDIAGEAEMLLDVIEGRS